MSGHSKWAQIKHQKGATDQKRGKLFSKLLAAIAVVARTDPNPQFNPQLRAAIDKAKENNVPQDNIERAVRRAQETREGLEELLFEAYGPGGIPVLIEAISDNRNRTVAEIKKILSDHGGKLAESGSVRWAFERAAESENSWRAKFPQPVDEKQKGVLRGLLAALEEHDDVRRVFSQEDKNVA